MILKNRLKAISIILLMSVVGGACLADIAMDKQQFREMVYGYFLAAKENISVTHNSSGLNVVLHEADIEHLLKAQRDYENGSPYVALGDEFLLNYRKKVSPMAGPCPSAGAICLTPYHAGKLDLNCNWIAVTACPAGCSSGSCNPDLCTGILCDDFCDGDYLMHSGVCVEGECKYAKFRCPGSCNTDSCIP